MELAYRTLQADQPQAMEAVEPERTLESLRTMATEGAPPPKTPLTEQPLEIGLEAIVRLTMRPAYFITHDAIDIDGRFDDVQLVEDNRDALEKAARGVGRLDLIGARGYAGTGWLVEKDLAVTNRHVAELFAEPDAFGSFDFKTSVWGDRMSSRLNYIRQHRTAGLFRGAMVRQVLEIVERPGPDIALLRVETLEDLDPLELDAAPVKDGLPVAAVGYPAKDLRDNDRQAAEEYFGSVFDVKRFSPGYIVEKHANGAWFLSDYTTLGGNSGSPVIDLSTGKAVGLHFGGRAGSANYAVAGDIVAATIARSRVSATGLDAAAFADEAPSSPESFAGRQGYQKDFLGAGELCVPHPRLNGWADDIAPVSDDADGVLKYHNFSVVQSKSRRLPLYTAVNIDGAQAVSLKRQGSWRTDGRLQPEHQIDNALYKRNPLDRGHLVRRKDPGWGPNAKEAERDTFHYTNCAPQHRDLNQRDWVGLEDYILQSADTRDFRVSVFTGPIYRDDDRRLRSQEGAEDVPIPREFWKIAVMVNADTGKLSATGYLLSHGEMIRDLTEAAFVLGRYETYQVQIARIEHATGLDFGSLRAFDPLGETLTESFSQAVRRIRGPESLQLSSRTTAAEATPIG